jgi:CubicO group peptidase (beta-lactamase class C family)
VSGKSLRAFAEENIFKPLGMKNTRFFDNRTEVVKNRAAVIWSVRIKHPRTRFIVRSGRRGRSFNDCRRLGFVGSDFYEPKVGNKELISLLTAPGVLNSGEKMNYASGLFLNKYKGIPVIKHSGNMSGFRSQIVSFPEQKFTAIALCNNTAILPSVIAEKLADIYLDGQLKPDGPSQKTVAETLPKAIPLSEKQALHYAGFYASAESGAAFKLSLKDGKLINSGLMKNETPVIPISENRLVMVAGTDKYELNPVFDKSGALSEIKLIRNGENRMFLYRSNRRLIRRSS